MAVNIHEAKTNFSKLIERVLQGEEITIAKGGRPVAFRLAERPQIAGKRTGAGHAGPNLRCSLARRAFAEL